MNWYQQNRWLGNFLIIFGICTLVALFFLFYARGQWDAALGRFNDTAAERQRLENLDPFPNEQNFRKVKTYLEEYGASLEKLKGELKNRALPAPPLAPNEFQSRLRQAMLAVAEKARNGRVKLPDNFALGFDEYTAALPNTVAAPLLGQELSQIELLVNILIDAHVDEITAFTRVPLPEEGGAAGPAAANARKPAGPAGGAPAKMLERSVVDVSFKAAPGVARKVLNQISSSSQQLFIARSFYAHGERDKGPPREQPTAAGTNPANSTPTPAKAPSNSAISFIVGNEHIEASARIEMLRFSF